MLRKRSSCHWPWALGSVLHESIRFWMFEIVKVAEIANLHWKMSLSFFKMRFLPNSDYNFQNIISHNFLFACISNFLETLAMIVTFICRRGFLRRASKVSLLVIENSRNRSISRKLTLNTCFQQTKRRYKKFIWQVILTL